MVRLLMVTAVIALAACGPQAVRTDAVRVFDDPARPEKDWGYAPGVIEVARGTTVTFTNDGAVFHTITSDDPKRTFDMGANPKEKVQIRFDAAGTWSYHCGVHPDMKGVVKVCDGECR